jgi:hypothetical protein
LELHKSLDFPVSLLSDSISQRASLFTYHLVRSGYSPAPPSRNTPIAEKTPISLRTDYVSSGLGSAIRTDFYDELATDRTSLTLSRTCHRHVTGKEIAHIVAEGLGLDHAVVAEGLGVRGGGGRRGGQGRGGGPGQVPDARRPANPPQATNSRNRRRPAARPVSPTPPGFEHNRGPAFIPFRIQDNGRETPARYIRAHLDAPNPYVEGRLSLDGPTYHSEIHAAAVHDVDIPPPPITADILRLLQTDYMGHDRVDEALGEIGDRSLTAEVARYRRLKRKRKSFQDSITRIEDQLFTCDIERRMCISRLEGARAMVRIQGEMQRNQQAFRLSPWSVERGRLP